MEGQRRFKIAGSAEPGLWRSLSATLLAGLGAVAVAARYGFDAPPAPELLVLLARFILPWLALVVSGDISWRAKPPDRWKSRTGMWGELAIILAVLAEIAGIRGGADALVCLVTLALAIRLNGQIARKVRNPSILLPGSFLVLIAISASLLKLPASTPPDQPISWVDAVFTSTSAICVTGLVVRDTGPGFTDFGHGVILCSIQIGGLGIMIFGSTLALLFGARLSYKEHLTLSMALDQYPAHSITRFAWFIVLTTFALEAIGAAILYVSWPEAELGGRDRLWFSVFHSVSAFCHAGFDITGQSMIGLRSHAAAYFGIAPMILIGGLGFIVLEELFRRGAGPLQSARGPRRLSTHSKLVLVTTGSVFILGFLLLMASQASEAGRLTGQHALDALFMSATARSAGLTTVPMEELTSGSRFTLMLLMVIGGNPSSTAGGMKTAVLALLVLAVVATIRGRQEVEVFGRALPDALVKKAATIAFALAVMISGATLILDLTEKIPLEILLFETVSAATTTGLSLGATEQLSAPGRVILTVTMFLGRVGPLALLAALIGVAGAGASYRLPRDTVSLG